MIRSRASERDNEGPVRGRCPTCGAGRSGEPMCHRCGSDLSMLLGVEARAGRLIQAAHRAYGAGRFRVATARARESARLRRDPRTLRLLACAALRSGDYAAARQAAAAVLANDRK